MTMLRLTLDQWVRLTKEVQKLGTLKKRAKDVEAWRLNDGSYVFMDDKKHRAEFLPFNKQMKKCVAWDALLETRIHFYGRYWSSLEDDDDWYVKRGFSTTPVQHPTLAKKKEEDVEYGESRFYEQHFGWF